MTPADLMDLGLKLFPVTQRKRPARPGWQKYAMTATIDHIRNDWREGFRAFGIYLAPSRLVVLDADTQAACMWAEDHLPHTPMMTLTRRGSHRYYRLPEDAPVPKDNRPLAGISLDRKAKGYVIAPGSVIGSFVYKETAFWDTPINELPIYPVTTFPVEHVCEPCRITVADMPPSTISQRIVDWFIANSEDSVLGQNGSRTLKRAASFFRNGLAMPEDMAMVCLRQWNDKRAQPAWSERELQHAMDTSSKEGTINGRPRGWAYSDWANT